MNNFLKWLDDFCYDHFDCNLIALIGSKTMVSGETVATILMGIDKHIKEEYTPRIKWAPKHHYHELDGTPVAIDEIDEIGEDEKTP